MQFFARLVFDRVRIALQPGDVTFQQVVLALKTAKLTVQALRVLPLLLVDGKTVLSKDDVVSHRDRKQRGCSGSDLSPAQPASLK